MGKLAPAFSPPRKSDGKRLESESISRRQGSRVNVPHASWTLENLEIRLKEDLSGTWVLCWHCMCG